MCILTSRLFLQAFPIVCKVDYALSSLSFFSSFFTFFNTQHVIACVIRTSIAHVIRISSVSSCYSFDYMILVHMFGCYILVHHLLHMIVITFFVHNLRINDACAYGFPASVRLAQVRPNYVLLG